MSATFYERACKFGAYTTNGGALDLGELHDAMVLYAEGLVDSTYVSARATQGPPSALTAPQIVELETLLATKPSYALSQCDAIAIAAWVGRVNAILVAGSKHYTGFSTEALVKTALGV